MKTPADPRRRLLDSRQMARIVRRMAGEIIEREQGSAGLYLVGIRTRGVEVAAALAAEITLMEGTAPHSGTLDITLYRDDLSTIGPQPLVKASAIPGSIEGCTVVLCDDVLFTGRTVRAALDALLDYGRPRAVRLAVLVDRGHRELPIQADYVGLSVETERGDLVEVAFPATDGREDVCLVRGGSRS